MNKIFILDTNVLLHNPNSIFSFSDNNVVLPMTVIEELDKFKKNNDELGRNAREIIRKLDNLRGYGSLRNGVDLSNITTKKSCVGQLQIITGEGKIPGLSMEVPDNRILRVGYNLKKEGQKVIFVSKDINVRLKSDALGIDAQDFEKQKVRVDELYTGKKKMTVSAQVINAVYAKEDIKIEGEFYPNESVLLIDETNPKHSALTVADKKGKLFAMNTKLCENIWNITPRSKEQKIALNLLMNPEIKIVTLIGQAGTGKTLLAIAAGLENVLNKGIYEKILVSRPIIPMGKDIGYLPGDKDSKLTHWMQPIFDNLEFLMHSKSKDTKDDHKAIDKLLNTKKLDLEALTYIRGRSIPHQYVIIDEAQNLTPHEIKTIISRAGEGTKIVLTGDPYQIDNPYLDMSSNGLSYAVEKLKSHPIHGHITLQKSERSELAAVAAEYL